MYWVFKTCEGHAPDKQGYAPMRHTSISHEQERCLWLRKLKLPVQNINVLNLRPTHKDVRPTYKPRRPTCKATNPYGQRMRHAPMRHTHKATNVEE